MEQIMNRITIIFLASLISCSVNFAVANPSDRGADNQSGLQTITMDEQNSTVTADTKSTDNNQSTDVPVDPKNAQTPPSAQGTPPPQSEESKLMEQSQSMDESTTNNDNKPVDQNKAH
jgi:hypothetical protein